MIYKMNKLIKKRIYKEDYLLIIDINQNIIIYIYAYNNLMFILPN